MGQFIFEWVIQIYTWELFHTLFIGYGNVAENDDSSC